MRERERERYLIFDFGGFGFKVVVGFSCGSVDGDAWVAAVLWWLVFFFFLIF